MFEFYDLTTSTYQSRLLIQNLRYTFLGQQGVKPFLNIHARKMQRPGDRPLNGPLSGPLSGRSGYQTAGYMSRKYNIAT